MSKYNTFLQLILLGGTLTLPLLLSHDPENIPWEDIITGVQYLVAGTTLWSGFSYAILKDAVKILGTDQGLIKKQGMRGRSIVGVSFSLFVAIAAYLAAQQYKAKEPKTLEVEDEHSTGPNAH